MESIAWLADRAAESGVTLGLEFCNRYETNVLNTTEQTLQFIERTRTGDNVVAHLDTYHMNIEETSFREPVLAAAAAGQARLRPRRRVAPWRSSAPASVPWAEFFAALHEVDYQGTITFESFSSEVVHPTLSSALPIWRNLWTDSMQLAKGARAFIRENYGC